MPLLLQSGATSDRITHVGKAVRVYSHLRLKARWQSKCWPHPGG
jgi:hypothetical protein